MMEKGAREPSSTTGQLSAKPLGQLLVMQSVVGSLPDEASIFSFVCRGLTDVPGVAEVRYSKELSTTPDVCVTCLPLKRGNSTYGELQLTLADPAAFAPYKSYLENFNAMLTILLEERNQRRLIEAHQLQLEQRIQERTAAISELEHFSFTITHDLRSPLRALNGYATILLQELPGPPSAREYLQRIINASNRMDRLITDTLNYSKLVRQEIPMEPVDAAALLHDMIETYPNFQPPGTEITIQGPLPQLLANEATLTQCFSNLLNNSVKFVRPGQTPRIVISAEDKGTRVRLWFQDNGIGISPDNQQKLFGMFQRLNPNYEGTGIGLALVRKAAERMNGTVGVESEEGKGARFWLEFEKAGNKSNSPSDNCN